MLFLIHSFFLNTISLYISLETHTRGCVEYECEQMLFRTVSFGYVHSHANSTQINLKQFNATDRLSYSPCLSVTAPATQIAIPIVFPILNFI